MPNIMGFVCTENNIWIERITNYSIISIHHQHKAEKMDIRGKLLIRTKWAV